jgi:hypothetical protein
MSLVAEGGERAPALVGSGVEHDGPGPGPGLGDGASGEDGGGGVVAQPYGRRCREPTPSTWRARRWTSRVGMSIFTGQTS